jgi:hypothetical protein
MRADFLVKTIFTAGLLSTTPRSYKNNLIAKLVSIFANIEEKKG